MNIYRLFETYLLVTALVVGPGCDSSSSTEPVRTNDIVDVAVEAGFSILVTAVRGQTLTISLGSGARVNDAGIQAADIEADNGVIHVIDAVLLPPQT